MKNRLSFLSVLVCLVISGSMSSYRPLTDDKVYICTSKASKKYHLKKNCRGLNNCKSEIKLIPLTKAKELKRSLCGWEN